jgi:RNA polymerase sigma-70 factor (ECF subfamily)
MSRSRRAESPLPPAPLAAPAGPTAGSRPTLDDDSRDWLHCLTADNRGEALERLRALLLGAARFEVERRRDQLLDVDHGELDALARSVADAALSSVLADLDHYHGGSRFTTWAAKFALLEASVRLRKLAWHHECSAHAPSRASRLSDVQLALRRQATMGDAIGALSADQRHVFETLTVDGVPIDVLAEDMQTTRADVYQTLQAARGVLRRLLTHTSGV